TAHREICEGRRSGITSGQIRGIGYWNYRTGIADGDWRARRPGLKRECKHLRTWPAAVGDGQSEIQRGSTCSPAGVFELEGWRAGSSAPRRKVWISSRSGPNRHPRARACQPSANGSGARPAYVGKRKRQANRLTGIDRAVTVTEVREGHVSEL